MCIKFETPRQTVQHYFFTSLFNSHPVLGGIGRWVDWFDTCLSSLAVVVVSDSGGCEATISMFLFLLHRSCLCGTRGCAIFSPQRGELKFFKRPSFVRVFHYSDGTMSLSTLALPTLKKTSAIRRALPVGSGKSYEVFAVVVFLRHAGCNSPEGRSSVGMIELGMILRTFSNKIQQCHFLDLL